MAVLNPLKLTFTNWEEGKVDELTVENHPDHPEMGARTVRFSKHAYIEQEDFMEEPVKKFFRLAPGKEVRLKGAYIIQCNEVVKDEEGNITELLCTVDHDSRSGSEGANRKVKGTLHWLSDVDAMPAEFRLYEPILSEEPEEEEIIVSEDEEAAEAPAKDFMDRINPDSLKVVNGFVEPYIGNSEVGASFQFLRMGYFCKDKDSTAELPVYNRTVGLKDSWAKVAK